VEDLTKTDVNLEICNDIRSYQRSI